METQTMYADIINGDFDMTREDLIEQVKENPFFSNPEQIAFIDSLGCEYTGQDALNIAHAENLKI